MTSLPAIPPGHESTRRIETLSVLAGGLAQVAVESWRLARLISRLCDADRARVQAVADRLEAWVAQAGVTIEDHTGQAYVDGMALEIVTTEPRADLAEGTVTIVETLKPSVYVSGQLIVRGQVVLGRGVGQEARGEGGTDGTGHD